MNVQPDTLLACCSGPRLVAEKCDAFEAQSPKAFVSTQPREKETLRESYRCSHQKRNRQTTGNVSS